jgi:hypothetical protein
VASSNSSLPSRRVQRRYVSVPNGGHCNGDSRPRQDLAGAVVLPSALTLFQRSSGLRHDSTVPAAISSVAMKKLVAATALALCLPVHTNAQSTPCEPLVLVGAAAALLNVDIPVDPELAGGGRFGLAEATGLGLEGSVHMAFPIAANWSVLTEFGTGTLDVLLERDASGNTVNRKTGNKITLSRLNVGLVRYSARRLACVYASGRVGLYRFEYRGVTLNAPGGAGAIGVEVPVSESGSVFFEMELNLALTKTRPPITPAGVVANVRPAFGFRYRF